MILVAGSTGFVGQSICRRLAAEGKPVRALVRPTAASDKFDALRQLGVEIATGDVRDRASLEAACQRVSAVISTVSAMPMSYVPGENDVQTVDETGLANLIDAAQAAQVGHFIYTSFSGNMDLDFPLRNAKRATEARVQASGMTYTILRPSYFMEVWLSPIVGFDYAGGTVQVYGNGEAPISFISLEDVAQFAVASLGNPAARNAVLELGGPAALSPHQVIRLFEQAADRSFAVNYVPETALAEQQKSTSDPMQQSFAGLMRCYARGDAIDMRAVQQAFALPMTTVAQYATVVTATPVAAD